MKRLILLTLILLSSFSVCRSEESDTVLNIPQNKYTIIKTTSNYTPLREGANVDAKRFSHLKKGAKIFADEDKDDFYRIDLGLDRYLWIEKKYTEVETTAENKELPKIESMNFKEDKDCYTIKIKTPFLTAYNEIETSNSSLDFILYDVVIDKETLLVEGKTNGDFKISEDEFGNLKISYFSNFPLTGHEVEKTDDGLLLKIKKPFKINKNKPLSGLKIVIDPGHGGLDPGACAFGLKEKDLNLEISKILKEEFKKEGAKIYLTREEDVDTDLYDRIDFAKEKDADFLISIHQNSLPNPKNADKKHGTGVYYYNKEAYLPSVSIQKALVEGTGFRDDGVNFASFALTRSAYPVCVLVECGYIIYEEEAKKLSDEKFQKLLSKSLIKGLKNYLTENF